MIYWVQVDEYTEPVRVDLSDYEVNGVLEVLKALAANGELVELSDADNEIMYSNYDTWSRSQSANSSTRMGSTKRYIKSDAHKYRPLSDSAVSDEYDVGDVVLNLGNMYKSCVSHSGRAYLAPDTTIEIIDGNYAVVQDDEVILYDGEPTHITKRLNISSGLPLYRATTDNGDMFDLTLSHYRAGTRRW